MAALQTASDLAECRALDARCGELESENAQLRADLMSLARRLAAASEVLSRAAERGAVDQGVFQG